MRSSLKSKVTVTVLALVLLIVASLSLLAYRFFADEFKAVVARQQSGLVAELAVSIDEKLLLAQRQVIGIAGDLTAGMLADPDRLQEVLDGKRGARVFFDDGLEVVGRDGRIIAESPYRSGRRGFDLSTKDFIGQTLKKGKPQISDPFRSPLPPHNPAITFTAPVIAPDGTVLGLVAGRHNLLADAVIGSLANVRIGETGYFYLFSHHRLMVMHRDKSRIMEQLRPGANRGIDLAIDGFEGLLQNKNSRGVPGLSMFKQLTVTGWVLAAHFPLSEAYAPLYKVRYFLVVLLVLVSLFSTLFVWLFMGRLTAPLHAFTRHISTLADKKAEERIITMQTGDEIATLAETFNTMIFDLEEHRLALERSEQLFRTIVECAHDLIFWLAPDHSVSYITPNCLELTGYEDTDFFRDPGLIDELVHPADRELWLWHRRQHCRPGAHLPIDLRLVRKNGEIRWTNHSCRVLFTADGEPLGIRGSFRDITEQVGLESKLQEEKSFIESLVQNATVPIFVLAPDHRIIFWNKACEKLTGLRGAQMIGTTDQWRPFYPFPRPTIADLIIDNATEHLNHYYNAYRKSEVIAEGYQAEGWFHDMNGLDRYIFFDAAPIRGHQGELIAVIETLKDISERKIAEDEIRKLSRAMEQSPNAIIITDLEGTITYVNPRFTALSGYGYEEAVGQNPRLLNSGEIPLQVYAEMWQTIKAGGEWRGELLNRKKNGEHYWEMTSITNIKDSDGNITHFLAVKEDVSERKKQERELQKSRAELIVRNEEMKFLLSQVKKSNQELAEANAELKATQAQMLQREKMASIGQLAAGVAHEINNPIGFINSNLGSLEKYVCRLAEFIDAQEEKISSFGSREVNEELAATRKRLKLDYVLNDIRSLIVESLEGADRVRRIVQNLKSFSRVDEAEFKLADLNECLESTINIVWNELKYKSTLNRDYGEIPQLRCFPQQLNQVFLNLLVNAAHAIESQGTITVRTWHDPETVWVAISDTGRGIPEEIRAKIFEPFFTTKEVGKGTGLGLSISYEIVKKHGGEIMVDSEPGQGTTFTVRLPQVA